MFDNLLKELTVRKRISSDYVSDIIEFYTHPEYQYPSWLIEQFEKGISIETMAKKANCNSRTIRKFLKKFDLTHENYQERKETLLPTVPSVKKRKKKRVDRKKLAAAQTIKNLKEEGWSLRQIAAVLNSVPTTALKNGKLWHPEMVRRILKQIEEEK